MGTQETEREDFICIDFDAICQSHPGEGLSLEEMLEDYVDLFREVRDCGYTIVIKSDRAIRPSVHRAIARHLEDIGMPYDVIMPSHLLQREGFNPVK